MTRIDGNSILIVEGDKAYAAQLADCLNFHGARCFRAETLTQARELLGKYDFDLVISNYYLSDGVILQLIDWCNDTLKSLPLFTCVGYPIVGDKRISQRHSIVDVFNKNDPQAMLKRVSRLLFDFDELYESLLQMIAPNEILLEFQFEEKTYHVTPIEITSDSIFFQADQNLDHGMFGVVKFIIQGEGYSERFVIPGYLKIETSHSACFCVHEQYRLNWERFLLFLNRKQGKITDFMKKAAGF